MFSLLGDPAYALFLDLLVDRKLSWLCLATLGLLQFGDSEITPPPIFRVERYLVSWSDGLNLI